MYAEKGKTCPTFLSWDPVPLEALAGLFGAGGE